MNTPRLKELYNKKLVDDLKKELGLSNRHQVPRLQKIVLNVGIGKHKDDKQYHAMVTNTLRKITGQQPVDRMARKSIATYKIRAGMNRIGVSVTLRDQRMYEFLDRLVNVALPRVRDFHGVPTTAFDKAGNYSLGITEQSIFPELNFEDTNVLHGLQVNFVINAEQPTQAKALLASFGMPFEKEGKH
ncbi:MAG TPA: 50S ribosomal protein L5 [Patescibacteria group bacterium]|jgi:large subunit ribosomal protein L5|nr:50S ribosomal protein L5 [Patescibacteria group bacterium]